MIRRMAAPFRGTVELDDGTIWDERDYLSVAGGTIDQIGLNRPLSPSQPDRRRPRRRQPHRFPLRLRRGLSPASHLQPFAVRPLRPSTRGKSEGPFAQRDSVGGRVRLGSPGKVGPTEPHRSAKFLGVRRLNVPQPSARHVWQLGVAS